MKSLREKLDSDFTASELDEPLEYNPRCKTSAVLVATSAIDINGIKVTKLASKVLAKHAGLSLDSLSHWALVVVDRGDGVSYLYDLMSDREFHSHLPLLWSLTNSRLLEMLPTTKIMRNYPRCFPVTNEMIQSWTSLSYIGETTRTHDEILEMGK